MRQRCKRLLWLVFVILFALSGAAFSEEASDTGGGTLVVRVGYMPDTGFFVEDWPGHFSGFGYEFMQSLASYARCDFKFVPLPTWEACLDALNTNMIDILPEMPADPRKEPGVVRTDHVIGRFTMALFVRKDTNKTHLVLGRYEKGYAVPQLTRIAQSDGFTYDLRSFSTVEQMKNAFRAKEIDGYVEPLLPSEPEPDTEVRAQFDRQSYRIVMKEGRPELYDRINTAMEHLLMYQPGIRSQLFEKYLRGDGGIPLTLSRDEREYLRKKGKLKAIMFPDRKPISYFEDGEAKGAVPAILKLIAEDLGIEIEIVETESQEEAMIALRMGRVDLLANLYSDFSWANTLNLRMTAPYMSVDYVPVMRRFGTVEKTAPLIACPTTLFYIQSDLNRLYPQTQLRYYDSAEACLKSVSDGDTDLTYLPSIMAEYITWKGSYPNLRVGSDTALSHSLSLGVSHSADPRLLPILDQEVNHHLDRGKVRQILREISQSGESNFSLRRLIYMYPMQAISALVAFAALIIAAIWYRSRMQKKHSEAIAELGFRDQRTGLPNLARMEKELQTLPVDHQDAFEAGELYAALLYIDTKVILGKDVQESGLFMDKLRELVLSLREEKPWLLASGIDRGHPIYLCRAKSTTELARQWEDALQEHGYLDAPDARVWLRPVVGIASLRSGGADLPHTLRSAETAAHELDPGSRERVRFFDESLAEDIDFQQKIESRMEDALAAGEFKAWFQPKYDIETKRQVGAEAVVRWISPTFGFLPPGKFIPLLEKNGFVLAVDHALLVQSFRLQRRRLDAGLPIVPISVNQSRLHLTEEGYLDRMREVVDTYKLPPGAIELEITETMFGDLDDNAQNDNALEIIKALHDMGFSLSVDDFGSGYSSFTLLNQLPMDVMKIDRSLLNGAESSERMRSILARVIQLGHDLKMKVLCEGIETPEQEAVLLSLGCNYGQGFLNGKPMPMEEFEEFLVGRT